MGLSKLITAIFRPCTSAPKSPDQPASADIPEPKKIVVNPVPNVAPQRGGSRRGEQRPGGSRQPGQTTKGLAIRRCDERGARVEPRRQDGGLQGFSGEGGLVAQSLVPQGFAKEVPEEVQ